jgi:predicted hydrolase (HD superfamily)
MLTREQAFELVKSHVSKKNIVYHMIAVEAKMRELTSRLEEDEKKVGTD